MQAKLRGSLTYANVVATLALFIALGGGAYAATHLAKNSVGSKQLKTGAVKTKKLAKGAVTTSKVADQSLLSADFAPGQISAGATGPQGVQGPPGPSTGPAGGDLTGTYPNPQLAAPGVGARAFGRVASDGTLSASKNASVSHPSNGIYCVTPASSVTEPRVLIAAIDDQDGGAATVPGSGNFGFAIGHVTNTFPADPCPVGTHQVTTFVYNGDEVDDDDGGGNSPGGQVVIDNEPFTFVIP